MAQPSAPENAAGHRALRPPAWLTTAVLATVAMVPNFAGLALGFVPVGPKAQIQENLVGTAATSAFVATFAVVGVILRQRRPENAIGRLFLVFAVVGGISNVGWGTMVVQQLPGGDIGLGQAVAWLGAVLTAPVWGYLITALIVRFPTGQPDRPRDAVLLRAAAVIGVFLGALSAFRPGPFLVYPAFTNPIQVPSELAPPVTVAAAVATLLALAPPALAVAGKFDRYRHASTTGRLQLRWFAYAGVLTAIAGLVYTVIGVILAPENATLREGTYVAFIAAACLLPIAVLQAITRHHLYDIDTIIGRTFAYGALTAILAGVYTASLRLFNAIFVAVTGRADETALVLTTLVLATTFTPIKARLEKFAERRFRPQTPEAGGGHEPTVSLDAAAAAASQTEAIADLESRLESRLDAQLDERVGAAVRRAVEEALREHDARRSQGA